MEAWKTLENTLLKATGELNQVGTLSQSLSQLVLSYMVHHGFAESAKQFSSDLAPKTLQIQGSSGEGSTSALTESNQYPPLIIDTERRKGMDSSRRLDLTEMKTVAVADPALHSL